MYLKEIICILLVALIAFPVASAEDVKVEGIAAQKYSLIGGSGWKVDIDKVIVGPATLEGTTVSAGTAKVSPTIPRGTIDPNIAVGDRVEVFGALSAALIKRYGSSEYYIKKASDSQIPSTSSAKSETDAKGTLQLDSCAGN
jgi:hypothetical protein